MSGRPSHRYIASNPYGVETGQLWQSRDKRDERIVKVELIYETSATVRNVKTALLTNIRLDQFRRWRKL